MRMLVIKEETNAEALSARLLDGRLSATQGEAALASLQQLNPHADLENIQAGTVLFVPDAPAFNAAASEPIVSDALQVLERLATIGLGAAADRMKAAAAARTAEGAEVSKTLRSAAFRRVVEKDPELGREVESATAAIKEQKEAADRNVATVAEAVKGALASFRTMTRA